MIKINKITAALLSVMLSGNVYAANANIVSFIPGETIVQNGDMVAYNGECFIAKNNPSVWEAPNADSWFWETTECSGESELNPELNPNPNPEPEPEPEPEPNPEPNLDAIIPFVPGTTQVKNGDIVLYDGQCFIAKNTPSVWEAPSADSWFWTLTECSGEPGPEPEPGHGAARPGPAQEEGGQDLQQDRRQALHQRQEVKPPLPPGSPRLEPLHHQPA